MKVVHMEKSIAEQLEEKIKGSFKKLTYDFKKLKKTKPDLKTLTNKEYLWIIFSYNIYLKSEDLFGLLDFHKSKKQKIITTPYIILRSILEDYFYIKLLLADKDKLEINFKAYIAGSLGKEKKLLSSLLELSKKGKFILNKDSNHVTSDIGANKKIKEYSGDIAELAKKFDKEEFEKLVKIYSSVEEVCKKYDKIMGILKVVEKEEAKSLEWTYNFLYRFNSGFTHQVLRYKEDILDVLWLDKSYKDYNEILSLLLHVLKDLDKIRKS